MTVHHLFDYAYSCLHPSNKLLINVHVHVQCVLVHIIINYSTCS